LQRPGAVNVRPLRVMRPQSPTLRDRCNLTEAEPIKVKLSETAHAP